MFCEVIRTSVHKHIMKQFGASIRDHHKSSSWIIVSSRYSLSVHVITSPDVYYVELELRISLLHIEGRPVNKGGETKVIRGRRKSAPARKTHAGTSAMLFNLQGIRGRRCATGSRVIVTLVTTTRPRWLYFVPDLQ